MKKHAIATIDSDVLLRLKLGDEKAFEVVYWKYSSWVFNFIQSLLYDKSLAEDLTQTVFLKIWEKRTSIDPELGFDSFLPLPGIWYIKKQKIVCNQNKSILL